MLIQEKLNETSDYRGQTGRDKWFHPCVVPESKNIPLKLQKSHRGHCALLVATLGVYAKPPWDNLYKGKWKTYVLGLCVYLLMSFST